jgi:hypothetical protein
LQTRFVAIDGDRVHYELPIIRIASRPAPRRATVVRPCQRRRDAIAPLTSARRAGTPSA